MNLEDLLRSALKRREAPEGFTARVLARARAEQSRNILAGGWTGPRWWFGPSWSVALAAAALIVITFGTLREYRQRVAAERAAEQTVYALELAGAKLSYVQKAVLKTAGD